jgi:2-keto-3-deoxy-galactonokinase
MRAVRLILGVIIIVQGIEAKEWMYAIAGILLSGMAVANIGCCGVGGCQVPSRNENVTSTHKDITYEEIH